MEREKRIKSGRLLEVDFYPVRTDGSRMPTRPAGTKRSSAEQIKYNQIQSKKKLVRKVNANFDNTDIWMHLTFDPKLAPQNEEDARRLMTNYLRRAKADREREIKRLKKLLKREPDNEKVKAKLKKMIQPFRYIYVIEKVEYRTGDYTGRVNWHFHLFMTGGGDGDRDRAEELWTYGTANANRFRPDKFGPERAALYMAKAPQGVRKYTCSQNLKKPDMLPPRDGHISARQVERMASERVDDRQYWERRYKGYRFLRCYARQNPFNGFWYVSVVMWRDGEDPPDWQFCDWMDAES
jgi:translation initiation factor 2 beta subunit (eIF-2beta)/eIF-5